MRTPVHSSVQCVPSLHKSVRCSILTGRKAARIVEAESRRFAAAARVSFGAGRGFGGEPVVRAAAPAAGLSMTTPISWLAAEKVGPSCGFAAWLSAAAVAAVTTAWSRSRSAFCFFC